VREDDDPRTKLVRERMEEAKRDFARDSSEFEWWSDERYGDFFRPWWPRELEDIMPKDVIKHMRLAQHEALLAFRELLNYWIDRTEPEKKTSGGDTKTDLSGKIPVKGPPK
jgi:hypothetical protein